MKTVLITGFEPFGGESVNPSWEVVSGLDNAIIGECRVVARQLPCVFGESLAVLNGAIDALSPSLVLAVGQAGGRTDVTVERVAINVDDARIADNQGQQPVDVPIVANGPAASFTFVADQSNGCCHAQRGNSGFGFPDRGHFRV